jgi:uncharacterized membrane protein YczE
VAAPVLRGKAGWLPADRRARRLWQLGAGLCLLGAGIALMVRARLGLSPWDVLHQGISRRTGIDFGLVVVLVGLAALLAWVPLGQSLGPGTLANAALVGLIADGVLAGLGDPRTLAARLAALAGGVVAVGLGTGLYIGAGLGPGPRDGLMTGIARRGPPIWLVRTAMEASALGAGWLLGGQVGPGTLAFAAAIGPLAHLAIGWFGLDPGGSG